MFYIVQFLGKIFGINYQLVKADSKIYTHDIRFNRKDIFYVAGTVLWFLSFHHSKDNPNSEFPLFIDEDLGKVFVACLNKNIQANSYVYFYEDTNLNIASKCWKILYHYADIAWKGEDLNE